MTPQEKKLLDTLQWRLGELEALVKALEKQIAELIKKEGN